MLLPSHSPTLYLTILVPQNPSVDVLLLNKISLSIHFDCKVIRSGLGFRFYLAQARFPFLALIKPELAKNHRRRTVDQTKDNFCSNRKGNNNNIEICVRHIKQRPGMDDSQALMSLHLCLLSNIWTLIAFSV